MRRSRGFPRNCAAQWRRQWLNAHEKGTRQLVPALVDVHNPGVTGGVQNQPDFQAGSVDHRTHFVSEIPHLAREVMKEYSALTGREYAPILTYMCDDAEYVMVGLGSVTDDVQAVATHLRGQGKKVGVISVKLLQPFPEAEVVAALAGKKAVTVLERSDVTALTTMVREALFKARENADGVRHPGIPPLANPPKITTAIFGLGAHDLQPRHLVAAFKNMETRNAPFVYLGSQFFSKNPPPKLAELQAKLKAAYPDTELMALETEPNPALLPKSAFRIRFHSVGGYGTIATGKLLTDILAGALDLHSKAAPKYGSEKSGAPTNYYITLSPEPVLITNAELEDVEIVVSPDHKVFSHSNPLRGLGEGGTFILQSSLDPVAVWSELPRAGAQDHPRQEDQGLHDRRVRGRQETRADARARDAHDGHRLHRRGVRQLRPGYRGRLGRGGAQQDPPADRQEVRRQGRPGGRGQHGGDPRRPEGDTRARLHPARVRRGREGARTQERADRGNLGPHVPSRTVARGIGLPRRRVFRRGDGLGVPRRNDRRSAGHAGRGPVPAGRQRGLQGQGPVPPQRAGVHRGSLHRMHGMRARLPGRRDPECGSRHPRAADDRDPPARYRREPTGGAAARGLSARRRGARGLSQREAPAGVP